MDLIWAAGLSETCHRGEEQFKDGQGGGWEGAVWWRREPPLVLALALEMGQDGLEYFESRWLECEICKPCSASCVLFLAPSGVLACVQGDRRLSGKGGLAGMGGRAGAIKCLWYLGCYITCCSAAVAVFFPPQTEVLVLKTNTEILYNYNFNVMPTEVQVTFTHISIFIVKRLSKEAFLKQVPVFHWVLGARLCVAALHLDWATLLQARCQHHR